MKIILSLIFVFYFVLLETSNGENKNTKYGFTGLDNAKKIKATQVEKLINNKSITVDQMYSNLGKPIILQKFGLIGTAYMYSGHGKNVYLFQTDVKQVNGIVLVEDIDLGKRPIKSIILFLDDHNTDESITIWSKKRFEIKNSEKSAK